MFYGKFYMFVLCFFFVNCLLALLREGLCGSNFADHFGFASASAEFLRPGQYFLHGLGGTGRHHFGFSRGGVCLECSGATENISCLCMYVILSSTFLVKLTENV